MHYAWEHVHKKYKTYTISFKNPRKTHKGLTKSSVDESRDKEIKCGTESLGNISGRRIQSSQA